ncbi:MAG TPA: Nif11 family protein [Negativicutes bacterium]|nr:Nif11 family protein [Negativicutes bacterium]
MSRVHARSFITKIKCEAEFLSYFRDAKTAQDVVEKAADIGYDFTETEFRAALDKLEDNEKSAVVGVLRMAARH